MDTWPLPIPEVLKCVGMKVPRYADTRSDSTDFKTHPPGPRLNYGSLVMHLFDGAPTIVMKNDAKIDSELRCRSRAFATWWWR